MEIQNSLNHLDCLVGEQLSAVQFVQDYLQLHFDGNGLTCYVWPEIYFERQSFRFGDIEYRNKLCELIAKIVKAVSIVETELLTIEFEDNSKICLSLDSKNRSIVSEIAIFNDASGSISVFE